VSFRTNSKTNRKSPTRIRWPRPLRFQPDIKRWRTFYRCASCWYEEYAWGFWSGDKFFWVPPALVIPVAVRTGIHYAHQLVDNDAICAMEDADWQTQNEWALLKLPLVLFPAHEQRINGSRFAWQPGWRTFGDFWS